MSEWWFSMPDVDHIVPTDEEVELAAQMDVAMVVQHELGEWPIVDDDRDIARAVLRHVNENYHAALTWNPTPYRVRAAASPTTPQED